MTKDQCNGARLVGSNALGWFETDMTAAVRNSPMNDAILARTPDNRWWKSDKIIIGEQSSPALARTPTDRYGDRWLSI
jgi:hypothetical protein